MNSLPNSHTFAARRITIRLMNNKTFFLLSFVLIFVCSNAHASPEDSTQKEVKIPTVIRYIYGSALTDPEPSYHTLDTSMDNLEVVNPAVGLHYNYLSNTGSAASPQLFSLRDGLMTDAGYHSYDLYLFKDRSIRYFRTNKAFSELNYHLDGGKEQQITVALSQNIAKKWNAGLDFNRLGSTGFLKNGTVFHTNIDLYTWFQSENSRYNLLARAIWNSIGNQVNGGLHSDSIYDNSSVSNLALQGLLVNLTDAENRFRNRVFALSQFYDLGETVSEKTSDTTQQSHFTPTIRIEHSISLEAEAFAYQDATSGTYYKNSFFSSASLDSLHYYDLRNRISIASLSPVKNLFYYSFGAEHQWLRYGQVSNSELQFLDTIMENASVNAGIYNGSEKTISWKLTADYIFHGANKGDYKADATLHADLKDYGNIGLSGKIFLRSPEFIYQRYYSNHFVWENNFAKNQAENISVDYAYAPFKISAGAEISSFTHLLYLDTSATPAQSPQSINVMKFFLNKNFRLGKIHLDNSIIFQKSSDKRTLPLPDFILTHSLYFESWFYNNALLFRAGLDLHYHSSYYADAFMPATGLFYRQYEKKTGGFSLVDFYISFRIKTARVFLKLENIGDNFFKRGYYLTPHYPMQGTTFQLGVNWRFFDQ